MFKSKSPCGMLCGAVVPSIVWLICLQGAAQPKQSNETFAAKPTPAMGEIADPSTGARWVLSRDAQHPGGPARLVQDHPGTAAHSCRPALHSVIRVGDRVIVVDRTPSVEARFDAIALDQAALGAEIRARLKLNGKTVRVVALGPGHAMMVREPGVAW